MSTEQVALLKQKYLEKLSNKELAILYGVTPNTIAQRLYEYRQKCRKL